MADEELNSIMLDLQNHVRKANVKVTNLSTIAKKGDEKLVEKFMSETIFVKSGGNQVDLASGKTDILQSQLYVACFWGFKDIVKGILELAWQRNLDVNVNAQNSGTLWTPLHAATFQEHGPIIMFLLEKAAQPELPDAEGRTPKDFAAASDKVWGHFAALGLKRTPKAQLVDMGIIKKSEAGLSPRGVTREPGQGIDMADYENPSATESLSDPYLQAAAVTGDVLAGDQEEQLDVTKQPQFAMFKQ